jgi:endoglucanase
MRRKSGRHSSPSRGRRASRALALVAVLAACGVAPAAHAAQPGNPMAGAPLFVDPGTAAARARDDAAAEGRTADAALLSRIADTPQATWFIAADTADSGYVRAFWRRADAAPGTIVEIALHGLPNQVCAGDNAPGAASEAAYRSWIDGWAQLVGARRVVVFVEPDALAAARCLGPAARRARIALVRYAVTRLSALPHSGVYVDAGAGDWRTVKDMAPLLRAAGVGAARGFVLDVTHYDWTADEVAYGRRLSRALGGKHFVVNTAFNGDGPKVGGGGYHQWCNPPGRALGPVPTTRTPSRLVDAFAWVGNPGLSDGRCNGGPPVGTFWERWALELAANAAHAPDYPVLRRLR